MKKRLIPYLGYACVVAWLFVLVYTSAYYMPYFVVGMGSLYCTYKIKDATVSATRYESLWTAIGAILFSLAVTLANYDVSANRYFALVLFFLGYLTASPIFLYLIKMVPEGRGAASSKIKPRWVFLACFFVVALIDVCVLFTSFYPGILSIDSISQITQFLTGAYSNHHPYYHTQIVRLLYNLGLALFGTPNGAVAFYSVCQIFMVAAVFGYVLTTVYQKTLSLKWAIAGLVWYALMPYHVMYSFTLWKDVLWNCMITAFIVSMYRIFCGLGGKRLNGFLLVLSSLAICLLRSNGFFVYGILAVCFVIFFRKAHPKTLLAMLCVLVCAWVLKYPVLSGLNVTQPDTVESLSVPLQQIARVVVDEHPLSQEQSALLGQVVDLEALPQVYYPWISDPVKELIRESGNLDFLTENKGKFLKLWLELGMEYPDSYLHAWVDQTKGFWNGGYDYWIYAKEIEPNDLNIYQTILVPRARSLWENYANRFLSDFLCIFNCMGFHVWIVAAVFVASIARKEWEKAFLCLPLLAVIASLMIATPVFCEFRYAYCIFTSMPVVLTMYFGQTGVDIK